MLKLIAVPLVFAMLTGCATGSGADLNQTSSLAELEARIDLLEEKLNLAMKSAATAKVDAAAALRLATEQE